MTCEEASADGLAFSVVCLRDVVAPATVRAVHAAKHARPRLLLTMALAHQRSPGCGGEGAASGSTRKTLVHLSLLSKSALVGGDANSHTFRSESRYFSHGAPPRRDEASARREGSRLHAAACWFHPFSDASVSEARALALATYGLTLPGPTPASHALGSTFPTQVGTSVTTSQRTLGRPHERRQWVKARMC